MNGEHQASQLRLSAARHRITAFLDQIGELEASNFPHEDGKSALEFIRAYSEKQLARLDISPSSDPGVIDGICSQISFAVQRHTEILGFILRSTNVRNPFELHFPLKRLLKSVIGEHARLLISSEWNFVPFTYPMNLDLLPNFALVGIPASESGNVLVTPLAGHEIGHSAWRTTGNQASIEASLFAAIEIALLEKKSEADRLVESLKLGELGRQRVRQGCLNAGIKQLEEIFCDAFGMYVFGASYLYAFEYFLAPGGSPRSLFYPADAERIRHLLDAAGRLQISAEGPLFQRWRDSVADANANTDFLTVLDVAVGKVAGEVIQLAFNLLRSKGVEPPNDDSVTRIKQAFSRAEPDAGGTLPEVVTAGWLLVREREGLAGPTEQSQYKTLADLMLKSVEVTEFLIRVSDDA